MTICGTIKVNKKYCPVVYNENTREVFYCNTPKGSFLLKNIKAIHPIETVYDSTPMKVMIRNLSCDGIIYTNKYVIVLDDGKAEYRYRIKPDVIIKTIRYSVKSCCYTL